ncbi:hypothetical protein BP5796_13154 [Coleophoma crateriformis]|uniref:Serine hydrolase domain-containing protein n=1 Tax=Coleophoma crateriformis TaxID=565419 RepID=A0A3D8Q3S9_9HELO|nr:hypothetical protein BP5796_13154 [Coleophoma crateriformis]
MFEQAASTLHLPRILCLHGGGTNAEIFNLQCRSLTLQLNKQFRLVFAQGPFFCEPHPAIIPVYKEYEPYRLWMRWLQTQQNLPADVVIGEIDYNIRTAMQSDQGTGEWVGLLGFSQGANVAASMLYERQQRISVEKNPDAVGFAGEKWRFGVLLAGRAPLVGLSELTENDEALRVAGEVPNWTADMKTPVGGKLKLPTVHVHGLLDAGLALHRKLKDLYCDEEFASLIEWEGDHRVPFKTADVRRVVDATLLVAKNAGVPLDE